MSVLAIIPARIGSRGIKDKNFKLLAGVSPVQRAYDCAWQASNSAHDITTVLSSDIEAGTIIGWDMNRSLPGFTFLARPPELAQDDTPMIDVIKDVLARVPGEPMQKVILLQPTQPLRTAEHLQRALDLLTPDVDSVLTVVESVSPDELMEIHGASLHRTHWLGGRLTFPTRRQVMPPGYKRDGTAYCFWRRTVEKHGSIYGERVVPLIIPAEETCALDTESDWREAERRLRDRTPQA